MKIANADVSLFSSYDMQKQTQEEESLEQWVGERNDTSTSAKGMDVLELSDEVKSLNTQEMQNSELDPKLQNIVRILEALTGKKINIPVLKDGMGDAPSKQGWGIEYNYSKTEIKTQNLNFSSNGNVKLEDGRSIDFKLSFSMKSESITKESLSFKAGDALIDPLVINFDSGSATLSNIKHNFDLNLDGKKDEFNFVSGGSGFLALDKNENKTIDDGSELFGPNSGNGFKDLSIYDDDQNGWIDENDAIFDKLLIWTKDQDGSEQLYKLKDKGVGALYLDSINTKFDFDDQNGALMGAMSESSIFLKENGSVGTLHDIDLKI